MRRLASCVALWAGLGTNAVRADEPPPSFTVTTSPGKKSKSLPTLPARPAEATPVVSTPVTVSAPLALPPPRPFAASPRGKATIALASIGGALVLGGAITGGLALTSYNDYSHDCDRGAACDPGLHDHAKALAHAADPMLFIGGAALVASVIVALVHRPPSGRR